MRATREERLPLGYMRQTFDFITARLTPILLVASLGASAVVVGYDAMHKIPRPAGGLFLHIPSIR